VPNKTNPVQALLIDARRTQILNAATDVFAEKGFHDATIRQVAQRAGIADGTIYLYFANKTELLLGILNRLNESERRAQDLAAVTGDFRSSFIAYMRHRLTLMDKNFRTFHAVLPDLIANPELRARYASEVIEPSFKLAAPFFQQWVKAGVLKPVNTALALRAISAMVLGILVLRMFGDKTVSEEWDNLPEFIADMILDGISLEVQHERNHSQSKRKSRQDKTRKHHKP
jgi:TetR/AcrR family fatty acid metabolism transcriptional regulator